MVNPAIWYQKKKKYAHSEVQYVNRLSSKKYIIGSGGPTEGNVCDISPIEQKSGANL